MEGGSSTRLTASSPVHRPDRSKITYPGSRALLHHQLDAGDVIGRDHTGRTVIQLAVDQSRLEQIMAFDAGATDIEDNGDVGDDGTPVLSFDRMPVRRIYRGRQYPGSW